MRLIKPQQVLLIGIIMILMIIGATPAYSQSRTHNLGKMSYWLLHNDEIETNTTEGIGTATWPQDYYRYEQIVWYFTSFYIGSWTDETGLVHNKETNTYTFSFDNEEGYGITEYKKYEPPEVWVTAEGRLQRASRPFNGVVDPDLPSDQMIELHYKAYPGFDVLKRTYSFSNQNHDDYVIFYNRYKCTFDWDEDSEPDAPTDQTIQDMYIAYGYSFQTAEGTWITDTRWYEEAKDDWATWEEYTPQLVPGGRELQISYGWDGDHPDLTEFETGGPPFDDTGDPRFAIGEEGSSPLPSAEFVSSAYGGFAALHADAAVGNSSDDVNQPVSVITNFNIYNMWDEDYPGFASGWDWAASGTKQTVEDQAGWPDDATSVLAEFPFQAFGSYDFQLGDSVVIVYVVAVNGISSELAVEKGLEWRSWYRGAAGAAFDDDAKNTLLSTGKDSLFESLDRAYWAWNRGMRIPEPLPAPDLDIVSGPGFNTLRWEDLSEVGDANTGIPDLDYYNVYRKLGNFQVDTYEELNSAGTHLNYEIIATVPRDQTTYVDSAVVRGQGYHYAVTAVDNGTQNTDGLFPGQKLESSLYANRSQIAAIPFAPGAETSDGVRIVPNPYIVGAGEYNFTGEDNRLLFANLPPYCTLKIYTVTGDLIATIEHSSGSADEGWDQVTESTQYPASAVYILQITNARNLKGDSLPDAIEKFVIIR